jgi:HK97 family phage portal protein
MAGTLERRGWLRRRGVEDRALAQETVRQTLFGAPLVSGPTGERSALHLVDVLACVRVIAEAASTLPLIGYRRTGEGRERLVGGRLVELLRSPAPGVTQSNLVGHLVASLAARGNAYLGLYSSGGQVEQLGVIDTDRVQVEIVGGAPRYTLTHLDGRLTEHTTDDIVHVRMPMTLNGVVGLSPIAQAREALALNQALTVQATALVANESTPLGVLSVPVGPAQDDLIENLRAGFEARHRGPRNAGRVAVMSGEVTFSAISISPHDAEFVEQRRLSTQEIARLFSVPPWMVNAPSNDSMTYANTETQAQAFVKFCLAPYLAAIEQAITNSSLCGPMSYVEFLVDALLRPDSLTRGQVYALALDPAKGWMTRAEVRARENLPPEEAA